MALHHNLHVCIRIRTKSVNCGRSDGLASGERVRGAARAARQDILDRGGRRKYPWFAHVMVYSYVWTQMRMCPRHSHASIACSKCVVMKSDGVRATSLLDNCCCAHAVAENVID